MKKIITAILFTVCWTCILTADIPILHLSEIKPGMKGIGKTVLKGSTIENFEFEVIDIIENYAPKMSLILVRLLGAEFERTGVISGMSGSPMYIDNKLVGALAYSLGNFMKDPIAGVTPIENMLEIEAKEKFREQEISVSCASLQPLIINSLFPDGNDRFDLMSNLSKQRITWHDNNNQLQPIAIPLNFSGFHPNVIKNISPVLEQMGFMVTTGGNLQSSAEMSDETLEPGDAVAGVLVTGDLDISATGTVTSCDGKNILAFGHPFFNSGPVNIPMAKAKVITILPSIIHSFKLAATGKIIGNFRQDRMTGVLGVIGEQSPLFPVDIEYNSPFDQRKTYHYEITKDQSLNLTTPVLFYFTILSTLESARFSNGDYSMALKGKIVLNGYPDVILDNFYTTSNFSDPAGSGQDIMYSAYDITMALFSLMLNNYAYPDIKKIELSFNPVSGKRSMNIEDVSYDKTEIVPGEELDITIQLRKYHGALVNVNQKIKIPENITEPLLVLSVSSSDFLTKWDRQFAPARFQPQSLDELISLLNNRRKKNALYVQLKVVQKGAYINGTELTNLPPTILNILSDKKTRGAYLNLNERVLTEISIPMDHEVFGGKVIRLKVQDHKTF